MIGVSSFSAAQQAWEVVLVLIHVRWGGVVGVPARLLVDMVSCRRFDA